MVDRSNVIVFKCWVSVLDFRIEIECLNLTSVFGVLRLKNADEYE